jgi:hypothetical protein
MVSLDGLNPEANSLWDLHQTRTRGKRLGGAGAHP